jgi:hypothetical protein
MKLSNKQLDFVIDYAPSYLPASWDDELTRWSGLNHGQP